MHITNSIAATTITAPSTAFSAAETAIS